MGFEPSRTRPVDLTVAGVKVSLSISSAQILREHVRALIAEAKLADVEEYLRYRIRMYEADLADARALKPARKSGRKAKSRA